MRELMDRPGYPELFARHLRDSREAARVTHPFIELLRTALAGHRIRFVIDAARTALWRRFAGSPGPAHPSIAPSGGELGMCRPPAPSRGRGTARA